MIRERRLAARRGYGLLYLGALLLALLTPGTSALARQQETPEEALAKKFAPIIILQRQVGACDPEGEPYLPAPVDVVFHDPAVVLREGPDQHPIKSPVEDADLYERGADAATDFPGSPRTPGCDYETHFKSVMGDQPTVIYAHVATEPGRRGVALQFWFFYYFNQFNNVHEGDWEMIQLLFDADTVAEALTADPVRIAFAQHSGGETSDWDAPKLEREGTRPVVYASRGSHASQYGPGLWLGWGQDGSGLGCDVTNGEPVRIEPQVRLIPETVSGPDDPFAWVTFAGRWGERETWVYDGPTGPAFKPSWSAPVSWMDGLRADSIRVNSVAILGPTPSGIFCTGVETASAMLTLFKPYPVLVLAVIAAGLALVVWALRESWSALRETWRVYRSHLGVFAAIGGVTVPITLAVSVLHYLLATNSGFVAATGLSEDSVGVQAALSLISLLQQGLLLLLVTPAVILAVREIVAGRTPSARQALRGAFPHMVDLIWTAGRGFLIVLAFTITIVGIPWAVNRSVRWMFGAPASVLGSVRGQPALADSATAVEGRWWQAAAAGVVFAFLGGVPGVVIGLALMVLARFPVDAANSVASLIYAVAQPFAIAGLTLLYLRWSRQSSVVSDEPGVWVIGGEQSVDVGAVPSTCD